MPLDIVLGASGLEEEFADGSVAMDLGGVTVPIIAVADLIVAKVLAGRPRTSMMRVLYGGCTATCSIQTASVVRCDFSRKR